MAEFNLCVVGAGLAAAGVAYELRAEPVSVTVLEKSRGVGGRAATRRRGDCRYDHGANYIKDSDDRTADLLASLGSDGLVDIALPVWPFAADGDISESNRPESHKWTWEAGITQLAKRLFNQTEATIQHQTRVDALRRGRAGWTASATDGRSFGPFDAVVLTPPAPQTAELLAATELLGDDVDLAAAIDAVDSVPYRTIRTLVFHYPFEVDRPYYGLVNDDRDHDIGWLSRESCKPGHVPDGEELLIVQLSPEWSTAHYEKPLAEAGAEVAEQVATLMDDDRLTDPDWMDDQGWRYALPDAAVDRETPDALAAADLHVAGDWVVGEGRAHAALWNGIKLGETLAAERL